MLKAFLQVEDDVDYGGDGLHGKGGPLPLWRVPFDELPPFDQAVRVALRDLGYPECDDYHAPGATGVSRCALTMRTLLLSPSGTGPTSRFGVTCS
jgi:hypothetical protein